MDYSKFQVEDFVTDEFFVKWVKKPDAESNAFWNAWLSENPECIGRIQEAREIIFHLDFKVNQPPPEKFLEIWEKIITTEVSEPMVAFPDESATRGSIRTKKWFYGVAATVALLVVSSLVFLANYYRTEKITTTYGDSRTLFLPDSTKVTLNSNSTIEFSPHLFSLSKREVSLTGEAFFSVVHKTNHANFIVHTQELEVEVLGTKFNVNSRRGNTKVLLEEGKVKLNLAGNKNGENVIMAPGDWVELSDEKKLTRKLVNPNDYLSWRNNQLTFISTPLLEISQLLEDNYGYQVVFPDDSLKNRKFTGSSSTEDIDELLEKLSRLYNLTIRKNGNQLIFEYRKQVNTQP